MAERSKQAVEKAKYWGKKALALGAIGIAGFFAFSPNELDIQGTTGDLISGAWGHGTTYKKQGEMDKEANAIYQRILQKASPSQLYELRYTDMAHIRVARTAIHHTGLASIFEMENAGAGNGEHYAIGDGCLNDTAFDVNGGSLHFNVEYDGLFSSVEASATGDFPTAAAQVHYDPSQNTMIIRTGNAHPDNLDFKIDGTKLIPEGQSTKDLLIAYGCKPHVEESSWLGY